MLPALETTALQLWLVKLLIRCTSSKVQTHLQPGASLDRVQTMRLLHLLLLVHVVGPVRSDLTQSVVIRNKYHVHVIKRVLYLTLIVFLEIKLKFPVGKRNISTIPHS